MSDLQRKFTRLTRLSSRELGVDLQARQTVRAASKMPSFPTTLGEAVDSIILGYDTAKPLIPTYVHLLLSALFCVYIGSHASLSRPPSAAKPAKKKNKKDKEDKEDDDSDDEEEEEQSVIQKMEGLSPSDAIVFPVMSGLTLAGLYYMLKHFDPAILNKVLNWYFMHAGFVFAVSFVRDIFSVLRSFVFPSHYSAAGSLWKADQDKEAVARIGNRRGNDATSDTCQSPLPGLLRAIPLPRQLLVGLWRARSAVYKRASLRFRIRSLLNIKARFTILDVLSVIIALFAAGYSAFVARPWWLINFLGTGFSYGALQFLSPTTFWTGSLILSSLFFYDIYFVFYTPMMVTVAKKLDIPIKLLFPRPPTPGQDPSTASLAMLGLGDIVVPGTMIGLALRFDLYLHYLRKEISKKEDGDSRPKYVSATGGWGERFWTGYKSSMDLPEKEALYHDAKSFPKTYFKAGIFGYVLGMLATLLAMQISNHPQPALLYLVPGVLSSIWITGFVNGDINKLWHFSDSVEDEDEEESKEKKEDETENAGLTFQSILNKIFGTKETGSVDSKKPGKDHSDETKTEQKKKKEPKKNKKADEAKPSSSTELVSFSISLPASKGSTTPKNKGPENPEDPTINEGLSPISESGSSSPVLVERHPEQQPAKRRRTSRKTGGT